MSLKLRILFVFLMASTVSLGTGAVGYHYYQKIGAEALSFSTIFPLLIVALVGFVVNIIIGNLLANTFNNELAGVIKELNNSAPELTELSFKLNSLSSELSSSSTEQAAAVQETASSLEEITVMIRKNSDNASNAKKSSSESLNSVKTGQKAVSNMLTAIDEINKNNDLFNTFMAKNNEELTEMVRVITNIAEKTKVINDIVFQTKLLSFNASVEAARAGEQGKGFAVVAEEVGNLAQMSGNAANEISGLLEESISKVNSIVTSTKTQVQQLVNDGKEKIKLGVSRASDCSAALSDISDAVVSVESLVSEVANASGEQSKGIEEVNKAMIQIDQVTNQNSSSSQNVSASVSQVMSLSSSIKSTLDKLNKFLNGGEKVIGKSYSEKSIKEAKKVVKKEAKKEEIKESKTAVKEVKKEAKVANVLPLKSPEKAVANKKVENETHLKKEMPMQPKIKVAAAGVYDKGATVDANLPNNDDSRFEDI